MSGYQSFAVAGVGNMGNLVVEELLKKRTVSSVASLTRNSNEHDDLVAKGTERLVVDYNSQSSIQSALSGIDVVISTLPTIDVQEGLAVSAKVAGVKLFVPSDFESSTDRSTKSIWGGKEALKKKLRDEIKLPYAAFYNGPRFAELAGLDFSNGKMVIPGSGTADISWTTRRDVARFVAHVLTALPKDKIDGHHFRIEGDTAESESYPASSLLIYSPLFWDLQSYNQIVDAWKARTGKNVTVSCRLRSELEDAIAENPGPKDLISALLLGWDNGYCVSGKPEVLDSDELPNWKPRKVIDVLVGIYNN